MNDKLLSYNPASCWNNAYPIGNGRMGAMVYGGTDVETVGLNEETFYTGCPMDDNNYDAHNKLAEIRKLVFAGEPHAAEDIADIHMTSPRNTQAYEPMGTLHLDFGHKTVTDYSRNLDFTDATVNVSYTCNGTKYTRKMWCGFNSDLIILTLNADKKEKIGFAMSMDNVMPFKCKVTGDIYTMTGAAPADHYPEIIYNDTSTEYAVSARVVPNGGELAEENGKLVLKNADSAVIYISLATSFVNSYNNKGENPQTKTLAKLKSVNKLNATEELAKDVFEYSRLYGRVTFNLGDNESELPTKELVTSFKNGNENLRLYSLMFNYGRYMLIAGSYKCYMPANLQGIWNDALQPKWASAYTININLEMNYWAADAVNLSECYKPFFRYLNDLYTHGKNTAKAFFNCGGWCSGHNTDIWGKTSLYNIPGGSQWGLWCMGAVWLCTHVFEHYEYTGDVEFLKREYPVMRDAMQFVLDFVIEKDGKLVTCPSTSSENTYYDKDRHGCAVTYASAMDISLINQLGRQVIKTCEILKEDSGFAEKIKDLLNRLEPLTVDKNGEIREWGTEEEIIQKGHRHLSHLLGNYPFGLIDQSNKELYEAVKKSCDTRQFNVGGGTAWSAVWMGAQRARLNQSELAIKAVDKWIKQSKGEENLFNVDEGYPFQIDANFGYVAAVKEMLMRDEADFVTVLPALPEKWKTGEITGLKAKGGKTVSIKWNAETVTVFIESGGKQKQYGFANTNSKNGYKINYKGDF